MDTNIKAEIVADSLNPVGNRLTTFVLEYPRFIHAEMMTHRVFSRNAASSRAIPIDKMIQQIIDNPAMPVCWGKNQPGMQAKEELDDTKIFDVIVTDTEYPILQKYLKLVDHFHDGVEYTYGFTEKGMAMFEWLRARDGVILHVRNLNKIGLHKQISNRILEPWFMIRAIFSATDIENFFALRAHDDAQPEFKHLSYLMLETFNKSAPKCLNKGDWHIPFGDKIDEDRIIDDGLVDAHDYQDSEIYEIKRKIAIARCARVSYLNFEGKDDYRADVKLCDRLFSQNPKHLSPTEHVAEAQNNSEAIGNYKGWKQYRKFFSDENLKDLRVTKRDGLAMV
jgi:thymidylate synthase ThyX